MSKINWKEIKGNLFMMMKIEDLPDIMEEIDILAKNAQDRMHPLSYLDINFEAIKKTIILGFSKDYEFRYYIPEVYMVLQEDLPKTEKLEINPEYLEKPHHIGDCSCFQSLSSTTGVYLFFYNEKIVESIEENPYLYIDIFNHIAINALSGLYCQQAPIVNSKLGMGLGSFISDILAEIRDWTYPLVKPILDKREKKLNTNLRKIDGLPKHPITYIGTFHGEDLMITGDIAAAAMYSHTKNYITVKKKAEYYCSHLFFNNQRPFIYVDDTNVDNIDTFLSSVFSMVHSVFLFVYSIHVRKQAKYIYLTQDRLPNLKDDLIHSRRINRDALLVDMVEIITKVC